MEAMFAHDTNLFLSNKSIDTLFASMNVEIENVLTWFKSNKSSLNMDETKWLLFHLHRLCLSFLLKIYISKGNI